MTTTTGPRSLIRVLMRGDRQTGRQGEPGPSAVLAACRTHEITDPMEALVLLAYAYGYAVGLNDDELAVDHLCADHAAVVREGWEAGLAEDQWRTLPVGVGDRGRRDGAATIATAELSECGTYRYALSREWLTGQGTVLFVMLNPSTADAQQDDPTIRRCIGFAQRWGYRRLTVGNLYAYRATDPIELMAGQEAIGPENNAWLTRLAEDTDMCVAAWGASAYADTRAPEILALLADRVQVHALKRARGGQPRHPLYLRGDAQPFVLQPLRSLALPVEATDVH